MKTNSEIADKTRERTKRQNTKAMELWDSVTCRLPKGTKERIISNGYTVNGFINKCVLDKLKELDLHNASEYRSECTESPTTNQNISVGKNIDNENKIDYRANNEYRKAYKDMSQEEINAMLADIPLTGKVKTHDFGLQNIQNDIDARSASINKPVEQEPTLAEMAHELEKELKQRKESAKQEDQPPF